MTHYPAYEPPLTLAFSPCPNDTFMFDALVHGRVDSQGLKFETSLHDIEELNERATLGLADITKISFAHYPWISSEYQLLTSGAALGYGNGPLLIAREQIPLSEVSQLHMAIPGTKTTANLLFSIAFPDAHHKTEILFSEIEQAVLSKKTDAGLLIHETRFTYQQHGLIRIIDLGEFWEQNTGLPVPLGAIAVRRGLPQHIKTLLNALVRQSVQYAFAHPADSVNYIQQNAQSMEADICRAHIRLYVNEFSENLGTTGRLAVSKLFYRGLEAGVLPAITEEEIFV